MPGDKQFKEEVRNKRQDDQEGNEFYRKKAEKALAVLRKLG